MALQLEVSFLLSPLPFVKLSAKNLFLWVTRNLLTTLTDFREEKKNLAVIKWNKLHWPLYTNERLFFLNLIRDIDNTV